MKKLFKKFKKLFNFNEKVSFVINGLTINGLVPTYVFIIGGISIGELALPPVL